ncbi:alpha/beta hydrolase [Planococcus sp. ISL-109]|uniref:alpha/beta fold hydrolase n=1 Tax=Planococcus sp. ISL-109 TaxID=2819166 RepID=UPI001BE8A4AD|nr:alpha/beta hydrolase [Planococcus sp. ISL-109]MBT2582866.1 alpha/beta hydrolase [Planococcus sp. ISL-109]
MFYKYDGGELYYEVSGQDNNVPLVFLHGVAMDHKTFDSQVAELQNHYKVIAVDLPDHGLSSRLDRSLPYSKTCAHIIAGLLNQLNIDQAILIGQSLGSFIVSHAAYFYPDKVLATIHIGGGGLYPKSSFLLKAINPVIAPLITLIPSPYMFKMFADHKALKPQTRAYLIKTAALSGKSVIIQLTKAMIADMVEGISAPIQQPTLILYGDHEAAYIKRMNIKFHSTLNNSRLTIINDAHHIANQDNPDAFNNEVISFITEITN